MARVAQREPHFDELSGGRGPEAVDDMPKSANFRLSEPGSGFVARTGGNTDSVEAANFKTALRGMYTFQQAVVSLPAAPIAKPARS